MTADRTGGADSAEDLDSDRGANPAGGVDPIGGVRDSAAAKAPKSRVLWRGGSRRQALYFAVLGTLVVGLLLVMVDQWRKGLVVMGSSILLGGIMRAVLPTRLVGWLAVRNRTSDVVFCVLFGVLLIVTALVARGDI